MFSYSHPVNLSNLFTISKSRLVFSIVSIFLLALTTISFANYPASAEMLSSAQQKFEVGNTGWEPQGNTTVGQEVFAGQEGTGALLIRVDPKGPWPDNTKTARVGTPQYSKGISALPNTRYNGSVSLRGFDGSVGEAHCEIREYNNYKIIATHSNVRKVDVSSKWENLSCTAVTSSSAKQIALRIFVAFADNGEKFLADNASLKIDQTGTTSITTQPTVTTSPATVAPITQPTTTVAPTTQPAPTTTVRPPTPGTKPVPNASNTGVRQGTRLTPSGSVTVTQDGEVIENLHITGMINVKANNVTIRNVKITGTGLFGVKEHRGYTGLVMEDIEIAGIYKENQVVVAADAIYGEGGFTLRRGNIHGFVDGAKIHANTVVEDSYFHDNARIISPKGETAHTDGLQLVAGSNIVLRNNAFRGKFPDDFSMSQNLMISNVFGPIDNLLIEDNHFSGGNYTVNIEGAKNPSYAGITNLTFRNNVFAKNTWQYGPLTYGENIQCSWYGNKFDDGTAFNR